MIIHLMFVKSQFLLYTITIDHHSMRTDQPTEISGYRVAFQYLDATKKTNKMAALLEDVCQTQTIEKK